MNRCFFKELFFIALFILAVSPLINGFMFETHLFINEEYYMFFGGFFLIGLVAWYLILIKNISIHFNITDVVYIIFITYVVFQHYFMSDSIYTSNSIYILIFLSACFFFLKFGFQGVLNNWDTQSVSLFIVLFLLINLFQVVYGFLQLFGWIPNFHNSFTIVGSFTNPGVFAIYIATFIPFALGIYAYDIVENKFIRYLSLVTFISCAILLPFTFSRTAWIASFVGCFYICNLRYAIIERINIRFVKRSNFFLGIFGILLITISSYYLYTLKEKSVDGRFLIWKISKDIVGDNWLFGVGYDNFSTVYNRYQSVYFNEGFGSESEKMLAGKVPYAFNDYLQILIETGIIGLLLFLILILSVLISKPNQQNKHLLNKSSYFIQIAKASLITILSASLFAYPFQVVPQLILFIILLAISSAGNNIIVAKIQINRKVSTFFAVLLIAFTCVFEYKQIGNYIGRIYWYRAYVAINLNDKKGAEEYYSKAYIELKNYAYFEFNYASWLSMNKRYDESIRILKKIANKFNVIEVYMLLGDAYLAKHDYKAAEEAYKYCVNLHPSLFKPNYQLHKVYSLNGRKEDAIFMAEKIVNMTTKLLGPEVKQMKSEMLSFLNDNKIQDN